MGRQVNFYMTEKDEEEFVAFVRSTGDVCILPYRLPTESLECLENLPEPGTPFWLSLYLWNRDLSPEPRLYYIEKQKHWYFDDFASEVIEFSRCYWHQGRLGRGRIWAEMTGWDENEPDKTFRKSDAFQKWYSRLARWIKRKGKRDKNGDYVLPGAQQFAEQGGVLVQAVFADGSAL